MANDLEGAISTAASKIAAYVDNVATMTVETRYVEVAADQAVDFEGAFPAARTVIKFDGDSFAVVPVRRGAGGTVELDNALLELHQRSVAAATEYRSRLLNAMLAILRPGS